MSNPITLHKNLFRNLVPWEGSERDKIVIFSPFLGHARIIISAPTLNNFSLPIEAGARPNELLRKKHPPKKKKEDTRCFSSIQESTKVKARKSNTLKCRQSGKDHERAFRGRGVRDGGRVKCVRVRVGRGVGQ